MPALDLGYKVRPGPTNGWGRYNYTFKQELVKKFHHMHRMSAYSQSSDLARGSRGIFEEAGISRKDHPGTALGSLMSAQP